MSFSFPLPYVVLVSAGRPGPFANGSVGLPNRGQHTNDPLSDDGRFVLIEGSATNLSP